MKTHIHNQKFISKLPKIDNDNRKENGFYVPFKREFEQNFLKLFGIIL
jgi:hypothetical protein